MQFIVNEHWDKIQKNFEYKWTHSYIATEQLYSTNEQLYNIQYKWAIVKYE